MITAGIDLGIETTKAVIVNDGKVASWQVFIGVDEDAAKLAEKALDEAVSKAGIEQKDVQSIGTTGLGDIKLPFVNKYVPEALSLARGINFVLPATKIVVDLGAGKSLAVKVNNGIPTKAVRSDKCAAGTGKYLDIVCKVLGISRGEIADLALKSKERVEVQSTCIVFAESEVISLMHMGKKLEDICKGALRGLAERINPLILSAGSEKEVALAGGVAQNSGLVAALEEIMRHPLLIPPEPQIVSAIGAGLVVQEEVTP